MGDEQLHLTLRFIGEVERPLANDLAAALARLRAEPSSCGSTASAASTGAAAALWAGVEPKAPVAALAAKVDRACRRPDLSRSAAPFTPHITLARWKRPVEPRGRRFRRASAGLASEPFAVDRFILFESHLSRHGPHY